MVRVNNREPNAVRLVPTTAEQSADLEPASTKRLLARRRDERHPTRVAALAHCHGRFQTVRIVDFSLGGLQLQGCFGVIAGEDITVELLSGHRLAATVAWSIGDRLGVRFMQPLATEDPALAVLQQRARRALDSANRDPAGPPQPRNE